MAFLTQDDVVSSPLTQVSHEDVYGAPEPNYSGETAWETLTRYSDAFWASAEENMITSKFALTAYQAGEELIEDVKMSLSGQKKDPNFNPYDYIEGYESYALDFKDCDTIGDVARIKKRIDLENNNIEAMSKVPTGVNFINNMVTGFLDPVNLIPVGGQAVKATGVVKGALTAGAVAGGTNAIQELILKEMSYNYTDEEYLQNVLIGTVFGAGVGAIGGAIGNIKDASYRAQIKEQIDAVRKNTFSDEFQVKKGDYLNDFNNKSVEDKLDVTSVDSTVGAAMVQKSAVNVAADVDLDNKIAAGIFKVERMFDPVAKLATSVSKKAREVANSLFELPYYTKNVQDAFNVEALNKQVNTELSFLNRRFADAYNRYYFDKNSVGFAEDLKLLNPLGKIKEGKMSQSEFYSGVWDYLRHGKNADNKYIVDCAKDFKALANIQLERINKLADDGVIDIRAKDKNWLPLMFDKDLVNVNTDDFVKAVSQKMKSYADDLRKSGEVEFKNKEIDNIDRNVSNAEADNVGLSAEIKKLNSSRYFLRQDVLKLEGRQYQLAKELDKEYRSISKSKERLFVMNDKISIPENTRDFAKQVKQGLKDKTPKSMGEGLQDNKILINDFENHLGKEHPLSLQNYKGRKLAEYEVLEWDDVTEILWEEGWYRERPYIDDVINDLIDDFSGYGKKYSSDDQKYLQRQYEIDEMRDVIGRLGYNYSSMSIDEIDALLSNIGNKKYLTKQYIEKARAEELSKATKTQQAKINKMQGEYDYIVKSLEDKKAELSKVEDSLQANRRLRNINKEDIKKMKARKKRFERDLEWQEKMLRLTDDDYMQFATEFTDDVRGIKDSVNSLDGIRIDDRGSLLSRDFLTGDISMLEPFIVKDITKLLSPLRKEMIDLNLIEKFGSVRLDKQIEDLNRDYGAARAKLLARRKLEPENVDDINKKIIQLDKEQEKDLDFLQYSVDSMRGTEYAKGRYSKGVMKATELAKLYNIATSLGRVTFSSIPDLMGSILKTDLVSAIPALKILKNTFNADLAKKLGEVPELAHAISELHANFREMSFAEMTDTNPFKSGVMKKAKAYTDIYMHATLMSRWNALIKSVSGMSFMNKAFSIGEKLSKGLSLADGEAKWVKLYGFVNDEMVEVFNSMNKYGNTSGAQKYANSGMWGNKALAQKFQLGVNKIMDMAVVTPGAEKMKAFRDPILSTVLQFKQFIMSSTVRTLVPALQNARDYNTAIGIMTGLTLGMLSVAAKDGLSGKTDRAPGDYITEGFAASGIAGWTELPYTIINAMTRGGFDKAMYAATGGFLGKESMSPIESERILLQQLGPSFGKIRNLSTFIGDVSSGNIKESSMYKLKSLIPFQNTIYLDWVLRQVLLGWSE